MSAFIVEDSTIDHIITYLFATVVGRTHVKFLESQVPSAGKSDMLGQLMLGLNYEAVECRYGESTGFDEWHTYTWKIREVSLVQVYKSLRCWLYQCSEGDIEETSHLYQAMQGLSERIAYDIISNLPEWESAVWE